MFSVISTSTDNTLALTPNQESEINQIQWSTLDVLSIESSSESTNPSAVVDSDNNMYVVWEDFTDYDNSGSDSDIFYKKYNAADQTWGNTVVISTESTLNSFYPSIAIDSENNIHVVWYDYFTNIITSSWNIYYKNYTTSTQSWGNQVIISTESSSDQGSTNPSMVVDSNDNLHVVWSDGTDYDGSGTDSDIFYKKYNGSTQSWGNTFVISTESSANSLIPSLVVDDVNNIHVVWLDLTDYNGSGTDSDIFYKNYNTTTQAWGNTIVVSTESSDFTNNPLIAIDRKDNLHVVWEDNTDYNGAGTDTDIFYKIFNSTSQVWVTSVVVSKESQSNSNKPKATIDKFGNVQVVWEDVSNYNGAGTDSDIFYKTFNFGLQTWTTTTVLSPTALNSNSPVIMVDSKSNLHFVWGDASDYMGAGSDYDIFYKTGIIIPEAPMLNRLSSVNNQNVVLDWDEVTYANQYKIYQSNEPIYNISGFTPVANITTTNYSDTLNSNVSSFYFFVVVASNLDVDSKVSNMVHIEIELITSEPNISTESGTITVIETETKTKTDTLTKTVTENTGQVLKELQNNDLFIPLAIGSGFVVLTFVIILRKRKKKRK